MLHRVCYTSNLPKWLLYMQAVHVMHVAGLCQQRSTGAGTCPSVSIGLQGLVEIPLYAAWSVGHQGKEAVYHQCCHTRKNVFYAVHIMHGAKSCMQNGQSTCNARCWLQPAATS